MRNIFRFLWIASMLGTISALFVSYAELKDQVYLTLGWGFPSISRDAYFFGSALILVVFSTLTFLLARVVMVAPFKGLPIPHKTNWGRNKFTSLKARQILRDWNYSISSVANYFLSILFLAFGTTNNVDSKLPFLPTYYLYAGFIFIAFVLVLPLAELYTKSEKEH